MTPQRPSEKSPFHARQRDLLRKMADRNQGGSNMSTRYAACAFFSLPLLLMASCSSDVAESVSTEPAVTDDRVQEEGDLKELMNQIRRDKFDVILPQILREYEIDMWIQVMREGNPDSLGADLGSNSGGFIFADLGGNRIERAVLGQSSDAARQFTSVRESGAYDIVAEDFPLVSHPSERELPGGPETELDHRFDGVGEFIAERDPQRIAVNYLERLGPRVES